jgi:transposase
LAEIYQIAFALYFQKRLDESFASLRSLSCAWNIPRETLRAWQLDLARNPEWTPLNTKSGHHRRIFDDIEESETAEHIRRDYFTDHRLFTSVDFERIIFERVFLKYSNAERIRTFACSASFITGLMSSGHFSDRHQHFKRRPGADTHTISQWRRWLSCLFTMHDSHLIINCHQTCWHLYPNHISTWWLTGVDDGSTDIHGDEKDAMTVLATISASGTKWPLFFLARGKTERVENSQIEDVGNHWRSHSLSLDDGEIFAEYLRLLRKRSQTEATIDLICDLHSSHRLSAVRGIASSLNIELKFIPARPTDSLRALHRLIFGVLKTHARRLFVSASAAIRQFSGRRGRQWKMASRGCRKSIRLNKLLPEASFCIFGFGYFEVLAVA